MLSLVLAASMFAVPAALPEIRRDPQITYVDRSGALLGVRGGHVPPPVDVVVKPDVVEPANGDVPPADPVDPVAAAGNGEPPAAPPVDPVVPAAPVVPVAPPTPPEPPSPMPTKPRAHEAPSVAATTSANKSKPRWFMKPASGPRSARTSGDLREDR